MKKIDIGLVVTVIVMGLLLHEGGGVYRDHVASVEWAERQEANAVKVLAAIVEAQFKFYAHHSRYAQRVNTLSELEYLRYTDGEILVWEVEDIVDKQYRNDPRYPYSYVLVGPGTYLVGNPHSLCVEAYPNRQDHRLQYIFWAMPIKESGGTQFVVVRCPINDPYNGILIKVLSPGQNGETRELSKL